MRFLILIKILIEIFREFVELVELYLKYSLAWQECEWDLETIFSNHDNDNQHPTLESLLQIYYI